MNIFKDIFDLKLLVQTVEVFAGLTFLFEIFSSWQNHLETTAHVANSIYDFENFAIQ